MKLDNITIGDILTVLPKPSDAIQAMIDGLREWTVQTNCYVDMGTYGKIIGDCCFGCAATATVWRALQLSPEEAVVIAGLADSSAIFDFELVINLLRSGSIHGLLVYYRVPYEVAFNVRTRVAFALDTLYTEDWEDKLEGYQKLADVFRELGY